MGDHQADEKIFGQPVRDRVDANALLPGFDFRFPDWTGVPLGAMVLVKVIDEEGDIYWQRVSTGGISVEEQIGALVSAADFLRTGRLRGSDWHTMDDDDE